MKLTIWGAAHQVTGSMHLLQTESYNILIDCGLDYEKGTFQEDNEYFPFEPSNNRCRYFNPCPYRSFRKPAHIGEIRF